MRKMGNSVSPVVELQRHGDTYTLKTESTFKSTSMAFQLGQEFQEETADGRTVRTKITMEGNKFLQEQFGEKPSTITREFSADKMIATFKLGPVTCVRTYELEV